MTHEKNSLIANRLFWEFWNDSFQSIGGQIDLWSNQVGRGDTFPLSHHSNSNSSNKNEMNRALGHLCAHIG